VFVQAPNKTPCKKTPKTESNKPNSEKKKEQQHRRTTEANQRLHHCDEFFGREAAGRSQKENVGFDGGLVESQIGELGKLLGQGLH
jgi:hypothetical protein